MSVRECYDCGRRRVMHSMGMCRGCYDRWREIMVAADLALVPAIPEGIPHRDRMASLNWEHCTGTYRFERWLTGGEVGNRWEAVMRCDRCRLPGCVPGTRPATIPDDAQVPVHTGDRTP